MKERLDKAHYDAHFLLEELTEAMEAATSVEMIVLTDLIRQARELRDAIANLKVAHAYDVEPKP